MLAIWILGQLNVSWRMNFVCLVFSAVSGLHESRQAMPSLSLMIDEML
jgi:hypothetical protein